MSFFPRMFSVHICLQKPQTPWLSPLISAVVAVFRLTLRDFLSSLTIQNEHSFVPCSRIHLRFAFRSRLEPARGSEVHERAVRSAMSGVS